MATLVAIVWPVPLLLLALAAGVILLRKRVAALGGLPRPYPADDDAAASQQVSDPSPVAGLAEAAAGLAAAEPHPDER